MSKTKGYILDEFDSPIDGKPCVAILTLKSDNRKTGDVCQVWILRRDVKPTDAINAGEDVSICGNCPHRKGNSYSGKRTCYVRMTGPNSVWKAYKAGKYADDFKWSERHILKGRHIRWGSYGDPAIINPQIFHQINQLAADHTGFTHQWREQFAQVYRGDFMASVDSFADYLDASAHGWKCYYVAPKGQQGHGKQCPATVENSAAQCITCRLCNGMKQDIYVEAHGVAAGHVGAIVEKFHRDLSHTVL